MSDVSYVPEMDGGEGLTTADWWSTSPCESAYMWLPIQAIPSVDMLMRASVVQHVNSRTGQQTTIHLAQQHGDFISVPRHLFPDWEKRVGSVTKIPMEFPKAGFTDNIKTRDASQQKAWEAFNSADHGVLNLACGKGKTVLALKKIASRNHPAIVVVNNTGLLEQWINRAEEFLGLDRSDIGIVQQKKNEWDKPLVIAMIHTLAKLADKPNGVPWEVRQRFGTIVFDEVHHLSAATFVRTAALFYGARFGLTATAQREDGLELVYYAHVGGIFYSDLNTELDSAVFFKPLPGTRVDLRSKAVTDVTGEFCVSKLYIHLSTMTTRNMKILGEVKKALAKGRKILVLVHAADHPKILSDIAHKMTGVCEYKIGQVSGKTKGPERVDIIKESDVTFATFQVAKEGLDVASLDTLFFATPFKSWGSLQQGKGRVERLSDGKNSPVVIIFEDENVPPAKAMCKHLRRHLKANGTTPKTLPGG